MTEKKMNEIMSSIAETVSSDLFNEKESDLNDVKEKATKENKLDAFVKLLLFEINFNMDEHKKEN